MGVSRCPDVHCPLGTFEILPDVHASKVFLPVLCPFSTLTPPTLLFCVDIEDSEDSTFKINDLRRTVILSI